MAFLEALHARDHGTVVGGGRPVHRRRVEVVRHGKPLHERGHALVGHAGFQRGAGGHGAPAAVGGDRAVLRERALEAVVDRMARNHPGRELAHRAGVDRGLDHLHRILAHEVAAQVPIGIEGHRVELAEPEVIAEPDHAIGEHHVVIGAHGRRQRVHRGERRESGPHRVDVVVARVQALELAALHHVEQRLYLLRRLPGGLEPTRLVEPRDEVTRRDRRGRGFERAGGRQLFDPHADQLRNVHGLLRGAERRRRERHPSDHQHAHQWARNETLHTHGA
jgi:hypothetical protein